MQKKIYESFRVRMLQSYEWFYDLIQFSIWANSIHSKYYYNLAIICFYIDREINMKI